TGRRDHHDHPVGPYRRGCEHRELDGGEGQRNGADREQRPSQRGPPSDPSRVHGASIPPTPDLGPVSGTGAGSIGGGWSVRQPSGMTRTAVRAGGGRGPVTTAVVAVVTGALMATLAGNVVHAQEGGEEPQTVVVQLTP